MRPKMMHPKNPKSCGICFTRLPWNLIAVNESTMVARDTTQDARYPVGFMAQANHAETTNGAFHA